MASTLARWLATLSSDELADVLRRRRDAFHGTAPQNLSEAAERLQSTATVRDVLLGMPKPCVEVAEVILAYGPRTTEQLAEVFHLGADDPTLDATLATCAQWAFAWPHDGLWHVPGSLRTLLPEPFELGPPAAGLLAQRSVDDLRERFRALRLYPPKLKADMVAALADFYADPARIRDLVEKAPPAQRDLIRRAAANGPVLPYDGTYLYTGRPDRAISYLIEMGLAISNWQEILVPREVALAVRGDGWHPVLTPAPPVEAGPPLDVDTVDHDATASAATALHEMAALLATCGHHPVTLLKTGDIGVREVRRVAGAAGASEAAVRLWLDLAIESGLIRPDGGELLPTDGADVWLAAAPADQLAVLYAAWRDRLRVPTFDPAKGVAHDVTPPTAMTYAAQLRPDIMQTAAALGPGVPVGSVTSLAARVGWRRPLAVSLFTDPVAMVAATWREAAMLGATGRDAVSTLGRAMIDGDSIADVAAALLPARTTEAIFQADLTVVVAGSPDPAVTALLDTAADRESRGAATTWRIGANSVRRALDSGRTATSLLAALRAVAVGGVLPQPLEYLVNDVARRHGTVRVRAVGCVLRADDPTAVAEILGTKALARLGLVALAPTVLASALDATQTLAALRAAGFAPMAEDAGGVVLLDHPTPRRAGAIGGGGSRGIGPAGGATGGGAAGGAAARGGTGGGGAARGATVGGGPARGGTAAGSARGATAAGGSARGGTTAGSARGASKGGAVIPLRREPVDPAALAEALLAAPLPSTHPAAPVPRSRAEVVISRLAPQLSYAELSTLVDAVNSGDPVTISYTDSSGTTTQRMIEPIELTDGMIVAWCHLRDDERNFVVSRIRGVAIP